MPVVVNVLVSLNHADGDGDYDFAAEGSSILGLPLLACSLEWMN